MAEKTVLFEDNMETQAQDFNNLQDWTGKSIDDIVVDAIAAGNYYTGLGISKAASTQVTIAPGRLYWGGAVYILEDPVTIDFQTVAGAMPVTQQRQIAIVAWNSTITTDVQPRNFVVDADTGQAQPESVAMTSIRTCNVGPIPGVEAPSPNPPAVPATNVLIGYVTLNPSGVVSIQQATSTQLANLTNLAQAVGGLLSWQAIVNGQIATLQTSLAALAAQLANYVTLDMFSKLSDLVNQIWQMVNRPPNYSLDTIDNFFDISQSAVGTNVDGAYNANVAEGIRFAAGASATTQLQLLNPTEPTIQTYEQFILPKPSGTRVRMDCSFPGLDFLAERILAHPYWVFAPRYLAWARDRFRCGVPFLPCPTPALYTWLGLFDPVYCNLRFDAGDTWPGVPCNQTVKYPVDDWDWPRFVNYRYQYFWSDHVDVFYWSKVHTNLSYSHNHYGQSFLNSQDGWLSGLTVFSMVPNYYQPLSLLIFRCDDQGVPDHQQCIARLDLDAAGIQACYGTVAYAGDILSGVQSTFVDPSFLFTFDASIVASGGVVLSQNYLAGNQVYQVIYAMPGGVAPLRINFTPVFLEAGKRYSFHLMSTFDHQFACTTDRSCYGVHQGDFWDYDGSYWFRVAGSPKTLRFLTHFLTWGQWGQQASPAGQLRYAVPLQPLQLAGGIQSIDVLAEHIIPDATDLSYAVQVSGKWMPFASDPDNPTLATNPALLPFQVIFTGTTDLMPGVSLVNSQVKLQGPATSAFHHISTTIPRGGSTVTGVKVLANVTGYVSAHHSVVGSLHYGSTHKTADVTASSLMADGVTTQFTWTFNATGINNYQVELDGSTDGTGNNCVVSQRSAFSA